jgi:DNA-binding transcriptional ArsR family regulator
MQMPTDDRILEALDTGLSLTPAVLAENVDKSRQHVTRRLSDLLDHGLVDRPKRGYYTISDCGQAYLSGELNPDELKED